MVGSPILNRELLPFLRSKRAFGGLLVFLVILSIGAVVCWCSTQASDWITQRDLLARRLFVAVSLAQLLVFTGYALVLTCTKVNSELAENTLDLLAATVLSDRHILLAKYASALIVILLLTVASIPVLAFCFVLGGVDWMEVAFAYSLITLAVLTYGMVGVACSSYIRRPHLSLVVSLLLTLSLFFVGGALRYFGPFAYDEPAGVFLLASSPLAAYSVVILQDTPYSMPAVLGYHAAFDLIVIVAAFRIALRRLRSLTGQAETRSRGAQWWAALGRCIAEVTSGAPGSRADLSFEPPLRDRGNPVYQRQYRALRRLRRLPRLSHYALGGVLLLALAGVLVELSRVYRFSHWSFTGFATSVLIGLFVPPVLATAITSERESNTLELLTTTLLSPLEILRGKFFAILKFALLHAVAFNFLLIFILGGFTPVAAIRGVFVSLAVLAPLAAITLFYASVGFFFSVMCRKSMSAIASTYATILGLAALPWVLAAAYWFIAGVLGREAYGFRGLSYIAPLVSPCLFFLPSEELNFWNQSSDFGNMIGYCLLMVGISVSILLVAKLRFELIHDPPQPRQENGEGRAGAATAQSPLATLRLRRISASRAGKPS